MVPYIHGDDGQVSAWLTVPALHDLRLPWRGPIELSVSYSMSTSYGVSLCFESFGLLLATHVGQDKGGCEEKGWREYAHISRRTGATVDEVYIVAVKRSDYTTANRAAWNEVAPIHRRETFDHLLKSFRQPGYSLLDSIESALLEEIGLAGKDVAQLCCNNGRELLSIKNTGAGRCVGFDISEKFIDQARELAEAGGIDCEFIRTDIYDIPEDFTDSFDLIYLSIGAMCWLPDLPSFFDILSDLLRPGGWLLIYDVHPVAEMFEPEDNSEPPQVRNSYFKTDAFEDTSGLDYFGGSKYESLPMYSFLHSFSKVFGCCLDHRFTIRSFCEYQHDIANCFERYQQRGYGIPLCYSLTAQKKA